VARGLTGALDGRGGSFASAINTFGVFFGSAPGSCRLVAVERLKRLWLGVSISGCAWECHKRDCWRMLFGRGFTVRAQGQDSSGSCRTRQSVPPW